MGFKSASTLEECINLCASTNGCLDLSYVNSMCYLKSIATTGTSNPAVIGAKLVSASGASSTTTSSAPAATGNSTSLSCPTNDGQVYNGFTIHCNTDYAGGDMGFVSASTLESCINTCSSTAGCVDASYTGSICYLKNTVTAGVSSNGIIGFQKVGAVSASTTGSGTFASNATTTATASATATGLSCPGSDQKTYQGFTIYCATDFFGGDMGNQYMPTLEGCISLCASTSGCVDISYANNICYLKNTLESSVSNSAVIGAKLTGTNVAVSTASTTTASAAAVATSSGLSCVNNKNNGATYKGFTVQCGTDYPGGDLGYKWVETLENCIDLCATTSGCMDIAFSNNICYLKSTVTSVVSDANVIGAKLPGAGPAVSNATTTSSSAVAASTSSVYSCPASDNQTYTGSNGVKYLIQCGTDFNGGDFTNAPATNFDQCLAICGSNSQCVSVSFTGTWCYLKNVNPGGVANSAIWGAVDISTINTSTTASSPAAAATTSAAPAPATLSCPASDNSTFTANSGAKFVVACATDYFGGDMGNLYANSLDECIQACDANPGCVDVSFVNNICYMKNTLTAAVSNSNIIAAKLSTL